MTDETKPSDPYAEKRTLVKEYLAQNARESRVEAELYDLYAAHQRAFAAYCAHRATMADAMAEVEIDLLITAWLARQQGTFKRLQHQSEDLRLHAIVSRWATTR